MKKNSKTTSALPDLGPLYLWYRRYRRDLPFRLTRDPYAIWISEVMLQQTRVAAMLPRYAAFMKEFPDVESLASASEDAVVEAWKGLGYYSRARNLRRAAAEISKIGAFPRDRAALLRLPGIGPYTASAVLSISFGRHAAVVDGNVKRVLARLFLLDSAAKQRSTEELAERLIAGTDPGEHNQAVMELGALVCLPDRPLCAGCPLKWQCLAFAQGGEEAAAQLPGRKKEPKRSTTIDLLLDRSEAGILFLRDPNSRFLKNHWMLPARIAIENHAQTEHWSGRPGRAMTPFRHTITSHAITARVHASSAQVRLRIPSGAETARFSIVQGQKKAASSLMQKALRVLE